MTICISSAPTAPLPLRSSAPLTAAPLPFPGTSQLGTPALGCSAAAFSLCQPVTQPCLQPCCSLQPVTQLHWAPQTPTALQRSGCWLQGLIHPADPTAGTCHQGQELPHKSTAPPCVQAAASGEEASFWVPEGERFCMPFRGLGRRSSDKSEIHL